MSDVMNCEKCNGTGLVGGHGHIPGPSDERGGEHSCYEAGCPYPCENCHGTGSYRFDADLGSVEVKWSPTDAPSDWEERNLVDLLAVLSR